MFDKVPGRGMGLFMDGGGTDESDEDVDEDEADDSSEMEPANGIEQEAAPGSGDESVASNMIAK